MKQNTLVDPANLMALSKSIAFIGISHSLDEQLAAGMISGKDSFIASAFEEMNLDKLSFQFKVSKADDGQYSLSNYRIKLYDPIALDKVNLSSPLVKDIEWRMQCTDWSYDLAESNDEWTKGYKDVNKMEEELRLLSHQPEGEKAAAYLWNNIVPAISTSKPGFIRRSEDRLGLYPQKEFTTDTTLEKAYQYLKDYRKVETALSEFEILEFKERETKSSIIHSLLVGEKQVVTLEQTIVPANHIEKYLVVSHDYPLPEEEYSLHTPNERLKVLGLSPDLEAAVKLLHDITGELTKSKSIIQHWDVMVIGKYHNKQIEYNFEGTPEVNTGHILATAYPISTVKNPNRFKVLLSEDLHKEIKVHETLNLQLGGGPEKIVFSDVLKGEKEIDSQFWNKHARGSPSEQLIQKGKSTEKKTTTTKEETGESLLPKIRQATDQRNAIKIK
ncbi:MAG: hypothetical protein ABI675_03040 [Chitinophagaceae bacterium]